MSKELPYFKFFPSEWISGDITLESMELQGVFMNVCCIYWSKSCRVAIAGLSQRYGEAIPKLLESGILKQKGGYAIIDFLNEQWVELYDRHEKNSKNGKLGNEKRWGKIATQSHIDKIREDKIRKDKIRKEDLVFPFSSNSFIQIWEVLLKEKKWKRKSFSALQASLDLLSKNSETDAIQMMKNTIAGEWQGIFELKTKQNGKTKPTASDYSEEYRRRHSETTSSNG